MNGGPRINLTAVLDLTFNAELNYINDAIAALKNAKDASDKAPKDDELEKKAEALGKGKEWLENKQTELKAQAKEKTKVRVATIYTPSVYEEFVDEGKGEVTFIIAKTDGTTPSVKSPPFAYGARKLKALHFLPPLPQTPAPAKTGRAPVDGRDDPWLAASNAVKVLEKERKLLIEEFSKLVKQAKALGEMCAVETNSDLKAILTGKLEPWSTLNRP